MPNPTARHVTATVTSDDVRRAFYESPVGSDWDAWIEEIQLDPLQIIYIDDDEGARYRVPIVLDTSGDGPDAVTFGEPVQVVIRYQDTATVAATAAGKDPIRFASRAESRPGQRPAATQAPADQPVTSPTTKEDGSMPDTINKAGLVKALGLPDDADEDTILDALDAKITAPPAAPAATEPVAASAGETTEVALLRRELDTANGKIGELVAARAKDDTAAKAKAKADLFAASFGRGVIGGPSDPERVEFERDYDEAPEVITRILASRADGSKFPVRASGYGTDTTTQPNPAEGDDYWFPGTAKPRSALATAGD
jgi:hypothetical protein